MATTTHHTLTRFHPTSDFARTGRPGGSPRPWSLGALFRLWRRRAREKAELARLDERALRDIGRTQAEVQRELDKPFWRD